MTIHNVLQHLKPHTHRVVTHDTMHASRTIPEGSSLVERSASSSTCSSGNNSAVCEKPENVGNLTIALAAAIPICVAIVVLYFLHRRIRRKLRAEDAADKHKSLDFGLAEVSGTKKDRKGRKAPEMAIADVEKTLRQPLRNRGLSMDMSSPYLLPAGVSGSRDSLHSMSRSRIDTEFDPYRPVTLVSNDGASVRGRMRDNGSVHTGSSGRSGDALNAGLLRNAARMSRTDAHTQPTALPQHDSGLSSSSRPPRKASLGTSGNRNDRWYPKDDLKHGGDSPSDVLTGNPATPKDMLSDKPSLPHFPQRVQRSRAASPEPVPDHQDRQYGYSSRKKPNDGLLIQVPSPTHFRQSPPRSPAVAAQHSQLPPIPTEDEHYYATPMINEPPAPPPHEFDYPDYPNDAVAPRRVSVMGMRPLPPDDPSDNPEQRANRIRSFYREYFDDSKPNPAGHYPQADPYDDYYSYAGYLDDGAVYDPETGAYFAAQRPYAQPDGRRAMTPPPRGPSHFQLGHRVAASTQSAGRNLPVTKKRLPPPSALTSLPTPHMLKDDMTTYSPIDFAPPTTFRDRQLGRGPDSPTGLSRPYSPAFRAHLPLVQSFDDLAVMPSPHALRKSGTFTALDFAPPPRFKRDDGAASDAGSIRSNRSGISAIQSRAIREGAYRVERLPKETVGTTADFATTLKPSWDMRN